MQLRSFLRDKSGVSAVEFALMAPLLFTMAVGTTQMGKLFFAHAGLRNLVSEGARFAAISPRPTDAEIKARLQAGGFGLVTSNIGAPVVCYGYALASSDSNVAPPAINTAATTAPPTMVEYADITVTYSVQLDYIFWRPAATVLTEKRRAFIYPLETPPTPATTTWTPPTCPA
jgi:Flp pilus assembly protein TadG